MLGSDNWFLYHAYWTYWRYIYVQIIPCKTRYEGNMVNKLTGYGVTDSVRNLYAAWWMPYLKGAIIDDLRC